MRPTLEVALEISECSKWKRYSQHSPIREPAICKTGATRVVPVLHIAMLFGFQQVGQWYALTEIDGDVQLLYLPGQICFNKLAPKVGGFGREKFATPNIHLFTESVVVI